MINNNLFPQAQNVSIFDDVDETAQPLVDLPTIPRNVEEQAVSYALADDEKGGVDNLHQTLPVTLEFLRSGRIQEMRQPIVNQERNAYISAVRTIAETAAAQQEGDTLLKAAQLNLSMSAATTKDVQLTDTQSNEIIARRGLEQLAALDPDRDRVYQGKLVANLFEYERAHGLRNTIINAMSKLSEPDKHDSFFYLLQNMTGIVPLWRDAVTFRKVTERAIGKSIPFDLNPMGYINALSETWRKVDDVGKARIMESIMKDEYGLIGQNAATRREYMEKLATLDALNARSQIGTNGVFALMDTVTGLGLIKQAILRSGKLISAMKGVAGERAAGGVLADTLISGETKMTGLTQEQTIGAAISAGQHPGTFAPERLDGLAPHMVDRLRDNYSVIVRNEYDRLATSTLTQEEIIAQRQAIENSWSPQTRKDVYAIHFTGNPKEATAGFDIYIQAPDGKRFRTTQAALETTRRMGFADDAFEIITEADYHARNVAEARANIRAYHGGDDFTAFRERFIGLGHGGDAAGWGFSASLTRDMAERFAQGRYLEGKAAHIYELNLPDQKFFLDLEKKFAAQSDEVKSALARTLTTEELLAVKKATGREVYNVLKNRLGGAEQASKTLDKAGIAGNTTTSLGRDREFVVFNEDVMNKAIVSKAGFTPRELEAERAARKIQEYAEDEAAFQTWGGDPVSMATKMHRGLLEIGEQTLKEISTVRDFDNPTIALFGKDKPAHQFSGRYSEEAVTYFTKLSKLVGMEKEHALFVTAEDLGKLAARPEFSEARIQKQLEEFSTIVKKQNGGYQMVQLGDKYVHLLGIAEKPNSIPGALTGAHEMGHMFDKVYIASLYGAERKALMNAFVEWVERTKGHKEGARELAERILAPSYSRIDTYRAIVAGVEDMLKKPGHLEWFGTAKKWLSTFDEFLAEQFTKFAATDARAVSIADKTFQTWGQKLREYFKEVYASMRQLLGGEVMTIKPEEVFQKLMDKHIERVNFMRENGLLSVNMDYASLDFTKPQASIRVPGKPHITPKVEETVGTGGSGYLIKYKMNDPILPHGGYDPTDIASMPWIAADPRHGASVDAMVGRVVGVHQTARTRADMVALVQDGISGLNKAQRQRVLAVLEEGDQASFAGAYGKEFSASELLEKGLTQEEMYAYFTIRQSRMLNHFIHDRAMVQEMRRKGLKEVEVFGQGKMAGMAMSEDAAKAGWEGKQVYDLTNREFVKMDTAKAYASGQRLIKIPKGGEVDGHEVTAFLAKPDEAAVREIYSALHYRPGEFARIYSDSYFIRMAKDVTVDGVKKNIEYPIRTAATEKEASEFIDAVLHGRAIVDMGGSVDELEKVIGKFYSTEDFIKLVRDGELKDMTGLRFHFTREIDDYLGQTYESHAHTGKLFTRNRGEHILTADRTREARSNILNPYESLSREISMVSHFAAVNEWKHEQIAKWMESFGDMLGSARTGDDVKDFFAAAGAKFSHVTGKKGLFAERTHAYIMRQIGIQTSEHRWWQALMRRIGETVQPYVGEGVGAFIRDANPLNFARATNHHLTLGMFNLSQLIVQANGAAVAASIHPIYGAKSAAMFPALRVALMSDNPKVHAIISKIVGEDVGEIAKAVRRTGIIDNLRSTSLHNIEDGKFDIFASMPRRAVTTAIEAGAFAFKRGEEAARLISFDIARREWMKLNPGKAWQSEDALKWIVSKSDDYTMNMTRANLARWQEGVMSIPTQFLQYNIKLAQNIASGLISGGGKGRGFTRSEALKALAGSIAFYGAAGMGISNMVGEWIPQDVQEKMNPIARTAIGQGMVSAAFKAMGEALTGERLEIALGTRLGSINFFTDLVYDAFNDPKNIYEAMLGPSKTTGERLGLVYDIARLWYKAPEVTLSDIGRQGLEAFTEQISSTRNLVKAYYLVQNQGVLKNRKGESVAKLSTPEIWAQAMGIAPAEAFDYYNLLDSKRAHFRALDGIADMIFDTQKKIVAARNEGDLARADRYERALQLMWPTNIGDFTHVQQKIRGKLFPYDTQFQKALVDHAMRPSNFNTPMMTTTTPPSER